MLKKSRVILVGIFLSVLIALVIGVVQAPNWIRDQLITEIERMGLRVIAMDAPVFSWSGVSLANIQLEWRDEHSHATIAIQSLRTDIQWQEQQISAIHIVRLALNAQMSSSDQKSAWPTLALPNMPIERLHIETLHAQVQYDDATYQWMGAFELLPDAERWDLELSNPTHNAELTLRAAENFQLSAQLTLHDSRTTLEISTPLRLEKDSEVHFRVDMDGALLKHLPVAWPWQNFSGQLNANGLIHAGAYQGEWEQIQADWQLHDAHITTESLTSAHSLSGSVLLDAVQSQIVLSAQSHAKIQLLNEPLLSPIQIQLGRPMLLVIPRAKSTEDSAEFEAALATAQLDGKLLASLFYDNVALNLDADILRETISLNPLSLNIPLRFTGSADKWQQSDVRFQQLQFNGLAHLQVDQRSPNLINLQLKVPMTLSWKNASYGAFSIAPSELSVSAHAEIANPKDNNAALSYQAKISSATLDIRDDSANYHLDKPVIHLQHKNNDIHLSLVASGAKMSTTDLTQSIQSLHVSSRAQSFAQLTNKVSVQGSQLDHPLLKDWPKPDLKLVASERRPGQWTADGDVLLQSKSMLHFSGEHQLRAASGQAKIQWQWPLTDLQVALNKRPKALTPLSFMSGDSQGQFKLSWLKEHGQWQIQAHGNSSAADAAIVWQESSGSGLNISASLDDLQKLNGSLSANMSAFALAAGINATALSAEIHKTDAALKLNNVHWKLLDAEWFVPDQEFLPGAELHAPMAIIGLNLEKILKLFDVHGLTGNGVLDGAIPITLKETGVVMEDAELHAREPGRLSYAPGAADPNENIGLKVLRNFHYKTLRVQFNYRSEGDYTLKLTLNGSNPDFYDGYPINMSLNIAGKLPGLFKSAIFSGDFNKHILESVGTGTTPP